MTQDLFYSICGIALFGIGLYGLLIPPHILQKILAVNVMGTGVFMVLIATAQSRAPAIDPVPHAMVLTGIVVAVAGTALALSLVCRIYALSDDTEQDAGR
ncbi:Na+/H+ antiporter subunit C [Exilibacterium tricleocarpae]|uniref:Na+/H+ antiporter subunit C n=1 Tax=Exilibacterium tricleocarpae TaxID=2591008 RepID=A0A545U6L8_9GAMM|nr:cation:proton antiporter subunit C [Exilibacterium tricleocarpae]TQV85119.1 Na+/H+ antiporter subunit C [Exilibacterium tricleocarpae]